MSGDQYTAGRVHGREERGRRPRQPGHAALDRAALRLGRPRRAGRPSSAATDARPATRSSTAACGSRPRSTSSLQKIAEKWVQAAAIVPHAKNPDRGRQGARLQEARAVDGEPREQGPPQRRPRRRRLPDRRAGRLRRQRRLLRDLDASPSSSRSTTSSARATASPVRRSSRSTTRSASTTSTITAGTMLMDVGTDFGGDYTPNDADRLERGPVRVRNALQFSLNIPAVKAMAINGPDHVFAKAQEFGMQLPGRRGRPSWPSPLGVQEVRPVDLVTAYGTLANGGKEIPHTTILTIKDTERQGRRRAVRAARRQAGRQPAGGLHRHRHPGRQHQPERQPVLGQVRDRRPGRPPAGDAQDRHEQRRQGPQRLRLHRAADRRGRATTAPTPSPSASGTATRTTAWCRPPGRRCSRSTSRPTSGRASSTRPAAKWPVTNFKRPGRPGPGQDRPVDRALASTSGNDAVDEWFIAGTEPKDALGPGHLRHRCRRRGQRRDAASTRWMKADRDWLRRAERGAGRRRRPGPDADGLLLQRRVPPVRHVAGASLVGGQCGEPSPSPTCFVVPTPDAERRRSRRSRSRRRSGPARRALPCPPASPTASPSVEPSVEPSAPPSEPPPTEPPPTPTPEPTPTPKPKPTPTPDATPTATARAAATVLIR